MPLPFCVSSTLFNSMLKGLLRDLLAAQRVFNKKEWVADKIAGGPSSQVTFFSLFLSFLVHLPHLQLIFHYHLVVVQRHLCQTDFHTWPPHIPHMLPAFLYLGALILLVVVGYLISRLGITSCKGFGAFS